MLALFVLLLSQAHAITHGQVPSPTDPIRGVAVEIRDTKGHFACSGTRIGRDIYITAAHCFLEGAPALTIVLDGKRIEIREHRVHPKYRTKQESATHDMAIFKTDPVDGTFKVATLMDLPKQGSRVMMAGYGDLGPRGKDSPGLHIAEFVMDESPGTGTAEIDGHITTIDANGRKRKDITGVCSGDSGGAGYVLQGDQIALWGVDSESYIEYPHTHERCAKREWVARVDYDREWIESVVNEYGAGAALVWNAPARN